MSRYLYEHLFLGHLHFEADATHRAFRLVRSSTPPGQPLQIIATRRPYDDPGVRALLLPAGARARSHPGQDAHALCAEPGAHGQVPRAGSWRPTSHVGALPSYAVEVASNPFVTFRELPVDSRYRFLLDEAAVLHHELHQGPGLPRPDGGGRDRGPVLGRLRRPRGRRRCDPGRRAAARRPSSCDCRPSTAAIRACSLPWRKMARQRAQLPADQEPGPAARASARRRPSSTCR